MPCPLCTHKQTEYHYSGADNSFNDPNLPKEAKILVEQKPYPIFEIRECEACGTPWFIDYFFADHPPLVVFGTALINEQAVKKVKERIQQENQNSEEIENYLTNLSL